MTDSKYKEMLMHLIVNQQAEILTLKNFILSDIKIRNEHLSEKEDKAFKEGYEMLLSENKHEILDGIRKSYGSNDDDLNELIGNIGAN